MSERVPGMRPAVLGDLLTVQLTGLDLALIVAAVLVVFGGLRAGLLARAAGWLGLVLGFLLSGRTVPAALELAAQAGLPARSLIAVLTLSLTITLTGIAVQLIAAPLRRVLTIGPLSVVDRALGAAASLAAFTLLAWLLLPTAAAIPGRVSGEVRASSVLTALDATMPDQPDVARTLRTLLGGERFPDVFAALAPTPEPSAPPEVVGIDEAVLARTITGSTGVRVVGCGRTYSGSGFAIDPDHVVTNAHVVAGARELHLHTHDGRRVPATVVVFDKDRDLALLEARGHGLLPLEIGRTRVGDVGAVIGYPGGQDTARVAAARVDRWVTGVGRDVYGRDSTERSLHFLAAELRSGDSGAPVVDIAGRVIGVVFAVSPDVPSVAYALAVEELEGLIAAARTPGDAGRCI
jgi:S1-C subfamily serine protease